MPELTAVFAAAIKFLFATLPAALGSFVSLKFMPSSLSKKERLFSLVSGYFLGVYFGRGLIEYLNIISINVQDAVMFGVGLFGLSFVSNAMVEIQPFVKALRIKFTGQPKKR